MKKKNCICCGYICRYTYVFNIILREERVRKWSEKNSEMYLKKINKYLSRVYVYNVNMKKIDSTAGIEVTL